MSDRDEAVARAFEELGAGFDGLVNIPGPGLDLVRGSAERAATAAYRLADLTRGGAPGEPGTVHGIRAHRAAEPDRAARMARSMLGADYIRDLLGAPPFVKGDTVTVDTTTAGAREDVATGPVPHDYVRTPAGNVEPVPGIRPCRIHTDSPCEGGCYGRSRILR